MLTIDNNDAVAVEEFGAPEELGFFEVMQCLCPEDCFPWLEEDELAEVNLLIEDHHRLNCQANVLAVLVPSYADKVRAQLKLLLEIVERQIAKMVRYHVHFRQVV